MIDEGNECVSYNYTSYIYCAVEKGNKFNTKCVNFHLLPCRLQEDFACTELCLAFRKGLLGNKINLWRELKVELTLQRFF